MSKSIVHRARAWRLWPIRLAAFLASGLSALLLLAACGGAGEEGTGIQPVTASVGTLEGLSDSSVSVNGVSYTRGPATSVTDGFDRPVPPEQLRLGMWVEVVGRVDDNGAAGVAESIRVRPASRGVVSASDSATLSITLFDSNVRLSDSTVIEGAPDTAALAPGDVVEVHGPQRNALGDLSASRVERLASVAPVAPAFTGFELRGRTSQLDGVAKTVLVGRRLVSYANAQLTLRSGLANGQMVRVSAGAAPPAPGMPWAVERLTSDLALPANLSFLYTEGFVDDLTVGPVFMLEDLPVNASSANGRAAVTGNGQRVAVVGPLSQGTLQARSVAVVTPGAPVVFTLSGSVTDFVSPAAFKLRGVPIDAAAASFVAPATAASIANDVKLRIKGTVRGRGLAAGQIEVLP
jgi:hypothetical protein